MSNVIVEVNDNRELDVNWENLSHWACGADYGKA